MLYDTQSKRRQTLAHQIQVAPAIQRGPAAERGCTSEPYPHRVVRFKMADRSMESVVDLKDFPEPGPIMDRFGSR